MRFLWGGTIRRTGVVHPSSGHESVMRKLQPCLLAMIITGHKSGGCGPWADLEEKTRLDDFLRHLWRNIADRLDLLPGMPGSDVADMPRPCEARKVIYTHDIALVLRVTNPRYSTRLDACELR